MSSSRFFSVLMLVITLAAVSGSAAGQELQPTAPDAPVSSAFTYQGSLRWNGSPASGTYDFRFILYNAASGGSQVGAPLNFEDIAVADGIFTVELDFGAAPFVGQARWMEAAVRPGASAGTYSVLSPRHPLTAVPYALYAATAWSISGNAGTTPGANFLGTTDNRALELKVNGLRALRLEPSGDATYNRVNVIGGDSTNTVIVGAYGATIAGGSGNQVLRSFSTIAGGAANKTLGFFSTVGGGLNNTACDQPVTIAGSSGGGCSWATVSGGDANTASGSYATIPGGSSNTASGDYSFAAGRRAKASAQGTFVWADSTEADFTTTTQDSFNVRATGGAFIVTGSDLTGLHVNNMTDGTPADNGDGIDAFAYTSRGTTWAALYAYNFGTSPAIYASSRGTYSGYFSNNIFVAGDCHGCTLAYVAVNGGNEPLEIGDLVAADGVRPPLAADNKPILAVRRASTSAIGVVAGRAALVESTKDGQTSVSAEAADGAIAPGDHLFIVVSGLAQTRADASAAPIAAGQRLTTAGRAGLARAQRTVFIEGMMVAEAANVVGVALEALPAGQGLIWTLVSVH